MLNIVIMQGRLVDFPEARRTTSGTDLCSFAIACETGYGESKRTDFINCTAWKKTAEFIVQHFGKGDTILIHGKLVQRRYQTKDGENRSSVEISVNEAYFAGTKRGGSEPSAEAPTFTSSDEPKFEDVTDDEDLPF